MPHASTPPPRGVGDVRHVLYDRLPRVRTDRPAPSQTRPRVGRGCRVVLPEDAAQPVHHALHVLLCHALQRGPLMLINF